MYFANAVYYTIATVGFISLAMFVMLVFALFNAKLIENEIGYRNYFIILGAYALGALPLAATLNGGSGRDFLFFLGCMCPALLIVSNRLEKNYKAARARHAEQQSGPSLKPVLPAPGPIPTAQDQRAYAPAPASLAHDFDVPPQR